MSIATLVREQPLPSPVSGGAMDRTVPSRRWPRTWRIAAGIVAAILLALLGWWAMPAANSQSVAANRLTIAPATRGTFDDFIPLRGRVTPLVTVFLDAVAGGRVERVLVEDGATLGAGQPIAILSNADLQLSVLARQSEVTEQLNQMRSQELALTQARLANERAILEADLDRTRAERQYRREQPLAAQGWVAGKTFGDTEDGYRYQVRRGAVLRRSSATDARLRAGQLAQLRASAASLEQSLSLARANLDALNLRAPVGGQLSGFALQVGESLQRGQRIGQIDSAGRNKLTADVDEFYLGRVAPGQRAEVEANGRRHRARVTKIYPQVQNGSFKVDLQFVGAEPAELQRGQSLQIKLTLGDPAPALLIPNGAFYNETGGTWIFVVAPDGRSATRRPVRLGRRNTDTIEVLDGLQPGERVVTSGYQGFATRDRLDLSTD